MTIKIILILSVLLLTWDKFTKPILGWVWGLLQETCVTFWVCVVTVVAIMGLGLLLVNAEPVPVQVKTPSQVAEENRNAALRDEMERLIRQSYEGHESNPMIRLERLKALKEKFYYSKDAQECLTNHTYEGHEPHPDIRKYANQALSEMIK